MITAGRSIASTKMASEVTRLIAPVAVTGEAAGLAASLAIEHNLAVKDVPVSVLQQEIVSAGGIIHFN